MINELQRFILYKDGTYEILYTCEYDWIYINRIQTFGDPITKKPYTRITDGLPYIFYNNHTRLYTYYMFHRECEHMESTMVNFNNWYKSLNEQQQKCYLLLKFEGYNI